MNRNLQSQSVLLLLVGGAVMRIAIDNSYVEYVRSALRPWLLVAGGLLVVVALICLARENVSRLSPRGAPITLTRIRRTATTTRGRPGSRCCS